MKIYNKLIRDKILDIISTDNKSCKTKILDDESFFEELNKKLMEEVQEYLNSGNVEELADIEEVISAILRIKKVSREQFESIKAGKAEKRGSFDKKLFLISVDEG